MADTNELGGFIQSLRAWPEHPEIVGLVRLPAWPGGTATHDTFLWLRDEMVAAVRRRCQWTAVLLALHGAMVADGTPTWRAKSSTPYAPSSAPACRSSPRSTCTPTSPSAWSGPPTPWCCTTRPRTSTSSRRASAAPAVLRRILLDGARPVTAFQKVPMVVPGRARQHPGPGERQLRLPRTAASAGEAQPRSSPPAWRPCSRGSTFPISEVAVLVVADGDDTLARAECTRLCRRRLGAPPRLPAGTGPPGRSACAELAGTPRRPRRPQRQRRRDHLGLARR